MNFVRSGFTQLFRVRGQQPFERIMCEVSGSVAPKLNGIETGTFVFETISLRWPKILGKIIDHFHRHRRTFLEKHGQAADADVKSVIHDLSELTYKLTTNKPLELLHDDFHDVDHWNTCLENIRKEQPDAFIWTHVDWLFAECYLYRRIFGCLQRTKFLKKYDCFADQKNESFDDHAVQSAEILRFMWEACDEKDPQRKRTDLITMLKMCLWGNRCDLSLSGGDKSSQASSPVETAASRDGYILVDNLEKAVDEHLMKLGGSRQVDIILDNAGFELLGDLVLAEFLLDQKLADKIVFHGKEIPWFVSDVTRDDMDWTLDRFAHMEDTACDRAASTFKKRFDKGQFVYAADAFWTSPHAYCDMQKVAPKLYESLSESSFLIFKGDLNYRKLVGDRKWKYTTYFKEAVRGFRPSTLLALRTLKAETVCGLSPAVEKEILDKFNDSNTWLVTGDYAVAQLLP